LEFYVDFSELLLTELIIELGSHLGFESFFTLAAFLLEGSLLLFHALFESLTFINKFLLHFFIARDAQLFLLSFELS